MGDSLLYSILPLAAPGLGIALPMVGVLLSVNRLVRLLSNGWASRVFERLGARGPFFGSLAVGLLATLLYNAGLGVAVFLVARMLWGVAWSGLRQGGYQAIWTGDAAQKGQLTGLLWGLVRLGSAISVLAGGLLYDRYGYGVAVGMAIGAALLAVPLGWWVRWPAAAVPVARPASAATESAQPAWQLMWFLPAGRWLTVAGFFEYLFSGVVVSTTALFVGQRVGGAEGQVAAVLGVATLTGLLHGVRWLTDLALGPLVGALSDRIGQPNTALGVAAVQMAAIAGALTLSPFAAIFCLLVMLVGDGTLHIVMSASATGVAVRSPRPHAVVGVFTTATDAGSALGPLIAYSLAEFFGLASIYVGLGAILFVTVGQFWRMTRRSV
jgi:MFS family permease